MTETTLFDAAVLTPSHLVVANENYQASRPPIRTLNVTGEILELIRNRQTQQSIGRMFHQSEPGLKEQTLAMLTEITR